MGGCGNLNETSVNVNLKESGEAGALVGGSGAGRGERRRASLSGNTLESLRSEETETTACLRLALTLRTELLTE